ncbi:MAG: citrate/2-methylcitrate synthase [Oscillospiraceae bacterium]|nr:citrate/2-methylcitrate synthase [Oscillospiraceae bacterium]
MPRDLAYYETNKKVDKLSQKLLENAVIDKNLYTKYDVKRGLRDVDGKGVLTGLTDISEILQNKVVDGKTVPIDGQLYYRGYNVEDIVAGFVEDNRFGFEETTYLLLFGKMPTAQELEDFKGIIGSYRALPTNFVRDVVMKAPSDDMMNTLARSVLTLYCYDSNPNDISIENVLRQCLQLIAVFPQLAVYGYQAYNHYLRNQSLYIHVPEPTLSTAEVILKLLRPDQKYTDLEAKVLDMALVLHAEHGGGNNSTFTTHVVTSSGTDTYSAISAALCSLKGPKHGGANVQVSRMFEDLKINVKNWNDEEEISNYLANILDKKAFDRSGLIYGVGHAVYSISDPRAMILKGAVGKLAKAKGLEDEYKLYQNVEKLAPKVIGEKKKMYKGVSVNVDFYSGFIYHMLNLPTELYTPLFAIARIAGWSAHRMEELINGNKIIRPAYMSIAEHKEYKKLSDR